MRIGFVAGEGHADYFGDGVYFYVGEKEDAIFKVDPNVKTTMRLK